MPQTPTVSPGSAQALFAAMQQNRANASLSRPPMLTNPAPAKQFDATRFQASLPPGLQSLFQRMMASRVANPRPMPSSGMDASGMVQRGGGYMGNGGRPAITDLSRVQSVPPSVQEPIRY